MINILKQGSSLLITSDNNQFPWKDGKMSVPLNSIAYIIDESDYVTFRSVANNDILFTSLIGELKINDESVSKDDLITMFDSVANSSGGGTASAGVNSINGYQGDVRIKTVNGTSLIGSGDISVEANLDNYYTKEESDEHYDYDKFYWNDFQYANDEKNWIHLRNGKSLRGNVIYFKTINGEKTVGMGDISFKTINGESLIGSGDITIEGESTDLSDYYTKQETNSLIPSTYVSRIEDFNLYTKDAPYKKIQLQYVNSDSETIITKEIILEWSGTQSEYDALGTYDDNITYNIIEG